MSLEFPYIPKKYICTSCNIETNSKKDYNNHILTSKHKNRTILNNLEPEFPIIKNIFVCKTCNKNYKARNSLWYHEKKCISVPVIENNNNINNNNIYINNNESIIHDASANEIKVLTNLVLELVKSNTELQKQMLEVCKNNQPINNSNSNNTNSHNKTFNLQFFLNEQCKDAMNISDFVNSFQLKLEDLEKVGEQGYVNGMSNIIIEKLKETDIYKRPFHCSDAKRETLYVKDINGWEREGAENAKMIKAVKDVGQKNYTILNDYRLLHPECVQADSAYNDKYVQMMIQAAGSHKDNVTKVIKKITKEVVIDKNNE